MSNPNIVNRMAATKEQLKEFFLSPPPEFPVEAVSGNPNERKRLVAKYNQDTLLWFNALREQLPRELLKLRE